jgi:hypothetical protein
MDNVLQTLANIAQIFSVIWVVLLGSKTISEIVKSRKKQPARNIFSWSLIFNLLTIMAIFVSLIVNISLTIDLKKQPIWGNTPIFSSSTSVTGTQIPSTLVPPAATTSSGGQSIHQQLPCSNATCNPYLEMSLIYSNVDVQKRLTTLTFTTVNNDRSELRTIADGTNNIPSITLQSALDAQPYQGYKGTSDQPFSIDLLPGQRSEDNVGFDFVPYQGVQYELYIYMPLYGGNITFDSMTVTFK